MFPSWMVVHNPQTLGGRSDGPWCWLVLMWQESRSCCRCSLDFQHANHNRSMHSVKEVHNLRRVPSVPWDFLSSLMCPRVPSSAKSPTPFLSGSSEASLQDPSFTTPQRGLYLSNPTCTDLSSRVLILSKAEKSLQCFDNGMRGASRCVSRAGLTFNSADPTGGASESAQGLAHLGCFASRGSGGNERMKCSSLFGGWWGLCGGWTPQPREEQSRAKPDALPLRLCRRLKTIALWPTGSWPLEVGGFKHAEPPEMVCWPWPP